MLALGPMTPCCCFPFFFLQSVDEVSNQMEDPFELIPLYDIMATYERDINRQA